MPRTPTPEQAAELTELEQFVRAMLDLVSTRGFGAAAIQAGHDGVTSALNASPSAALTGLRMAAADMLQSTRDDSRAEVFEIDQQLRSRGITTLTEMRARIWKQIPKILASGRIRDEEEYYLLAECLNDVEATSLSDEQRERAEELVLAFESSRSRAP